MCVASGFPIATSIATGKHTLVTATGAFDLSFVHCSCAARAVPSDSVSCMLICWLLDVSRLIASRMVFRAQGESPAPGLGKASNLFAASRATSLQRADNVV